MMLRAATSADVPALTELQRAYDTAWFGAPENDEDEVREGLDLADVACVVVNGASYVGAGLRWRTGSSLVIHPDADFDTVQALLVPWLAEVDAPCTEALDREVSLRAALTAAGWVPDHAAFDLVRPVSPEWVLPEPKWPTGVEVRTFDADHARALHELIYVDAAWAEVRGHHAREFDEWHQIFVAGRTAEDAPVLAWRADRPVGTAVARTYSDGTGWVSQLAVARSERGQGLGRALLLESFRRRTAAGAAQLGLSVVGTNRDALRLYLDIGLSVDREWQTFVPA
jgi:GNAT superfamily N-acetyltransferase